MTQPAISGTELLERHLTDGRRRQQPALIVLDARVPLGDELLAALTVPFRAVRVASERDGLTQLVAAARAAPGWRLVVVCHGTPGGLNLGDRHISAATLAERRDEVSALGRALGGAPIELYACSVAQGAVGRAFVAALEGETGCPVSAAVGPVGGSALGGSWMLDAGRPAPAQALDAVALAELPMLLATVTWDAATGDWNTAGNWSPSGGPTVSDNVTLDNGGTAQLAGTAASILKLNVGGGTATTLEISDGGTLSGTSAFVGYSNRTGSLLVDGSNSRLTVSGYLFVGDGSSSNGTLTVSNGGKVIAQSITLGSSYASSNGTLNIGDGGAPGLIQADYVGGGVGGSDINFNHNQADYVFSSDGTGSGVGTVIAGQTKVTQTGTGTTILIAKNTNYAGTLISAGTLQVGNGGTAGEIRGNVTNNATLAFNRSDELSFSGVVSGSGSLVQKGAGTLVLTGASTYTGGTVISDGTLQIGNGGTTGSITGDVTNNAILAFNRSDAVTFSGAVSGTGGLTQSGTGTLTLSGTNTYTGTTTVNSGTLRLSGGSAIADSATVHVAAGATLDLSGTTETIGALTGSGTVTVGAGTLSFTNPGSNSFSGTLTGTGTYSVASGVTLKGTGTYSMAVTIQSGGTIAPGNSPGTISTGDLTLASGATASMEINGTVAGTGYDQIAVTGSVTIDGATLQTAFGYSSAKGDSYVLISNDGADAVTGTFSGLAEGATLTSGGRQYQISYAGNDGNDVTLTDITASGDSGGGSDGGRGSGSATGGQSLTGGTGNDILTGTEGDDTLFALAGDDDVRAQAGADLLYGNQGSDTLWGHDGSDSLYGGQGADLLYGNQAADRLCGNIGDDTLYGGQDGDLIYGNQGGDALYGCAGSDSLYGGQDGDTLWGGTGDDALWGCLGADRFAFEAGSGVDTIFDFSAAAGDVIAVTTGLNGTDIDDAADLLARLSDDGAGNALLDLGAGNTVTLIGVAPSDLTADAFLIA